MPSNHLILCHPLLLPPSIFSSMRVFSNESVISSHQVAKVLQFQRQHQSFNEYSGLISFRMDWLDLLAVQGTLKSLLQHHGSKASILQCSAFFIVQLSHPYMTTGKTIALTRQIFVGKVMSLLLICCLGFSLSSRQQHLLISWLQSPSTVIWAPKKIVCHSFHYFPIYLPWSHGTDYITSTHHICFLRVDELPEGRATCYTYVIPGIQHHSWYTSSSWYQ